MENLHPCKKGQQVASNDKESINNYMIIYLVRVTLVIVELQLLVDVGLVHQGVEDIQHTVNIPDLDKKN